MLQHLLSIVNLLLLFHPSSSSIARRQTSTSGYYTAIGRGRCHDSSHAYYPAFHLVYLIHDDPNFQSFYEIPGDSEGVAHLNSVSKCQKKCKTFESNPLYRGYEIIMGRGCYCIVDHEIYDEDIGDAFIGEGEGSGDVVGSDGSGGYYCYAFTKEDGGTNVVNDPAPRSIQLAKPEYEYEPIHLLVGRGTCHDSNGRNYPSIIHTTDGSNRACRNTCNLVTPMKAYRGYEVYPREKRCKCLYDTSSGKNGKHRFLDEGKGGEGEIKGVMGADTKDVYCYRYSKTMKRTQTGDGKVVMVEVRADRSEATNEIEEKKSGDERVHESTIESSVDATIPSNWKHVSMGKGLCRDSESRTYLGIQYSPQKEGFSTTLECEHLCSHYRSSPHYRGYEAVETNLACKCIFDTKAKYDKVLTDSFKVGGKNEAEGEISGIVSNDIIECFKYVAGEADTEPQIGADTKSTAEYTYYLVGEGVCIDSKGGWFDAVEFLNTPATDCEGRCELFTSIPTYRGIEVTLSQVCFCLFDDGTTLDNGTILNYGTGKGEIIGVQKKVGTTGPFCFRRMKEMSDTKDTTREEIKHDQDEIKQEKILHDDSNNKALPPITQPSHMDENDSMHEAEFSELLTESPPYTYNSIFTPQQTQYDFLRFDPHSFSGAPLGGWGRDTRNRLASLPIRLVNGFDGNWYDIKNRALDKAANTKEANMHSLNTNDITPKEKDYVSKEVEINHDGTQVISDSVLLSNDEDTTTPEEISSPHPPHFVIHDGTGQKYVCRVYNDDELAVVSRMDSMFLPAITVDETNDPIIPSTQKTSSIDDTSVSKTDDEKSTHKKMKINFHNDDDSLAEAISAAVSNVLNSLGFQDVVAGFDDQNANGEADDINAMLTEIGLAASIGAGIDGAAQLATSARMTQPQIEVKKMTNKEIIDALNTLKGICSQQHLGWWSYEWCHEQEVKQFHVAVTSRETSEGFQYEIQDVLMIGHYNRRNQIIYPAGESYKGDEKKGTTLTMTYDSDDQVIDTDLRVHEEEEAEHWRHSHLDNEVLRKYYKSKNFDNRGPIVKQTFDHGDMCHEVGHRREMTVEMRCCTEDELLRWMKSKIDNTAAGTDLTKENVPKAALVGVIESKTEICHYTSHVCTPALCPVHDQTNILDKVVTSSVDVRGDLDNNEITDALISALGTAGEAIATQLTKLLEDNLNIDDVEVYVMDEDNAETIEDLLNDEVNPSQLKGLLNQLFAKKSPKMKQPVLEMKEGESVRELLDRSLGKKPCLTKNLGWWTYEYCHNTHVLQYHGADLIDTKTGKTFIKKETTHLLGSYNGSGNSITDYPNEEEHLHVLNATDLPTELDLGRSHLAARGGKSLNQKVAGGNGAIFIQEWSHGDTCDHKDVAESVIKGGNIVQGSIERSTTVRYSCGQKSKLMNINEDSTCHYVIDVSVPELCQHPLFKAPLIKTQVVKCLPL